MSESAIPKVAVVCAWYNRADHIRDTVDSLLAQEFDDFEIVIVNDGSTDRKVRETLDSYNDTRLRVIHQDNAGFVSALRRALDSTKAPYIAIQGAGDVSCPMRLQRQWEAMQASPDVAIVGCHYRQRNMLTGDEKMIMPRCPKKGDLAFHGLSHGELMYRREVYEAVKGYRSEFFVGQGADLWMRLLRDRQAEIIQDELYEQRIFSDGVTISGKKRAARAVLNAVRVENERIFRKTSFDHIDTYGVAAFSILGGRWNVLKGLAYARLMAKGLRDSKGSFGFETGPIVAVLSVLYGLYLKSKGRDPRVSG